ncbi:MAG: PdxA family protein [Sandaracinaceae bacterium]
MSLPLYIATGDPAGVGPSIALWAVASRAEQGPFVLVGDGERLAEEARGLGLDVGSQAISILDVGRVPDRVVDARAPSAEGGRAQLAALERAAREVLAGRGRALVTGPTSKAAIELAGTPFTGQTEHLARMADLPADAVTMMFLGPRLRLALATTHTSLRKLPDAVTKGAVERSIRHLAAALAALSRDRREGLPRIAVTGLNPHAGEGGLFGDEERTVIGPAIEASADVDAILEGPLGAETALRLAAEATVDGVVAMFHDQATIASKLLDWGRAVNVTWGLPFLRTSVDHGVAYSAAATGQADPSGMGAALDLAAVLTGPRGP